MYPQVFGKYVLERELSRGGMARVLLATLRGAGGFEKKLVVKQIRDELSFDQQFVRRFVEEAKTTVALSHPNIVPVYELGVEQGTYFLAMELVEGLSVADLLRERNPNGSRRTLTPEEGAYVGMEVCRALDYAHRRMQVVHRDITPRNVMIDEEGQVKLIDFGIAAPALVAGHEILGSPGHMPPEQVDGKELGPPTDLFAVAVLLFEAWTGHAPFRRKTPEECDRAMREPHPKLSDFAPRLAALDQAIARAMSSDPKERQQDAAELRRELRSFLRGVDVTDIAVTLGSRVRAMREAMADPTPPPSIAPRASMASQGDLGTRTFAARDEALRWSDSPPAPDPSTRRIVDEDRDSDPVSLPSAGRTPRELDPAMVIPTPLMIEPVGDLAAARELAHRAADAARRGGSYDDGPETIATRPLETPVRREPRVAPSRAGGRGRPIALVLGTAVLVAGGVIFWRSHGTGVPVAKPVPTPVAPVPTPTVPVVPTTSATAQVTARVPSPPASVFVGTAVARANVAFLGDPGTRVSVDGVLRGSCPIRVQLEAGAHEARFAFDPTGESRTEHFAVKSGEQVTVRAEFTGASPTVRIQRSGN